MDKFDAARARRDRLERARAEEAARIAAVVQSGFVPDDVGPVPVAPARGPVKATVRMGMYPQGEDGFRLRPEGHAGRKTLERADVFDRILLASAKRKAPHPLTPSQIATGRVYRDLAERHSAGGIKCSSLERTGSGGTGGAFIDALLRDREQLDKLHCRIGPGVAMPLRRVRPSQRGSKRQIGDRTLVDMVALQDRSIADVLAAHGWAVNARNTKAALTALVQILDRMTGPQGCGIRTMHPYGPPPAMFEDPA